jgi:predicted DCC family thiol-disulfide oxidoreductase YuxK
MLVLPAAAVCLPVFSVILTQLCVKQENRLLGELMRSATPLQIFYDGSCRVCSREMEHYRRRCPPGSLAFIDVSASEFDPSLYGKTQADFMGRLHVRTPEGEFLVAIEAFRAIWSVFPDGSFYRWLGWFVGLPGINLLARGGYALFARYRHLLPQKRATCADDESCRFR